MVSIRYKAFVPAGLLGIVLAGTTLLAHVAISQLGDANASLAGRYREIEEVQHIEINVNRLVYSIVEALTTGSDAARDQVAEQLATIRESVEDLRRMAVVNSGERHVLDQVENRLTHIEALTGLLLELPASEHHRAMAMFNDLSTDQLVSLSSFIHRWHDEELRQVDELRAASTAVGEQFRTWVRMFILALALLLLFALWLNNKILVKPVIAISKSTSRLASGDLNSAIKLSTNDELSALASDINSMASSLQSVHRRLEDMAKTDALTGLPNRRSLDEAATREIEAARRYRRKLAVCILDIDHFKAVNDTHGHHVGDEVLRAVARATAGTLRQSDHCYRIGGEEFVLLLQESDEASAIVTMERCREKVAAAVVYVGDVALKVTASFGAACFPADADSLENLLERADQALYAAKNGGRNRCCVYSSTLSKSSSAHDHDLGSVPPDPLPS